ncbi:4'-phosphopantetheinyl transferase superfamily protein [Streptomyces sp. NPDC020490]|uniref:4'-phosphopantetheinyl transferase superfamily protein n=1 Tax=Streptomyces sp. NPDC020490 TaxID=3365078 RepID=UPI0037AFE949
MDAEPALPLPRGLLGLVASERERRMVARLSGERPELPWDRLLFSAKEAVYKVWYPATRQWIGTGAVEVAFTTGGLLTAEVRPDRRSPAPARRRPADGSAAGPTGVAAGPADVAAGPADVAAGPADVAAGPADVAAGPAGVAARYTGRWHVEGGLLLTVVAVPAGSPTTAASAAR